MASRLTPGRGAERRLPRWRSPRSHGRTRHAGTRSGTAVTAGTPPDCRYDDEEADHDDATPPGCGAEPRDGISRTDDVADEDVDVLSLAGQRPPAGGAWLWVTTAEARRGGEFTALFLPRVTTRGHAAGTSCSTSHPAGSGTTTASLTSPRRRNRRACGSGRMTAAVRVLAAVAGSLIHVASWDHLSLDQWPEQVRATVAFAMGALRELQEHGADVGARGQVEVEPAAQSVAHGFPGPPGPGERRRRVIPRGPPARGRAPRVPPPSSCRGTPPPAADVTARRAGPPGGHGPADLTGIGEASVHRGRRRSPGRQPRYPGGWTRVRVARGMRGLPARSM